MLERVWVAHHHCQEAGWALQVGVALARLTGARLTLVHIVRADDEPMDHRERLSFDLFGLSAAGRARRRLGALAAELNRLVPTDVRVVVGPAGDTLLELLHEGRPDVLVAGTRRGRLRQVGPRMAHLLAAAAPCPVVLVRSRPSPASRTVVLDCAPEIGGPIAASLGWRRACAPAPFGTADDRGLRALRDAEEAHRPGLVLTRREHCSALRATLGLSRLEALLDTAACPVLVAPPSSRRRARC